MSMCFHPSFNGNHCRTEHCCFSGSHANDVRIQGIQTHIHKEEKKNKWRFFISIRDSTFAIRNTAILSNRMNCWMMLILLFVFFLLPSYKCLWCFQVRLFLRSTFWYQQSLRDKQYNRFTKSHFQYLLHVHAQFMKWRLNNWQTSKHSTFFLGLFTVYTLLQPKHRLIHTGTGK